MAGRQDPQDAAAFKRMIEADPENKKCFECGFPNPMWCDINHGVFICLECSGVHRSLGVHLSFVRSATIDDWSSWRPEKLRQMEVGGNKKARLFFDQHGVPRTPIRARYENDGALMYTSKLEADVQGKPFVEATWQPPEWKTNMQRQQQQGSSGGGNNNRFQGMGSAPQSGGGNSGGGVDASAWLNSGWSTVSQGWNSVSQVTSEYANTAAKNIKDTNIQSKATESASWAWGSVITYASAIGKLAQENYSQLAAGANGGEDDGLGGLVRNVRPTAEAQNNERFKGHEHLSPTQVRPTDDDDDDGLGALTRNVKRPGATPTHSDERFRGIGHVASPKSEEADDGWGGSNEPTSDLRSLAAALPKTSKYQGIGSSEPTSPQNQNAGLSASPLSASTSAVRKPGGGGLRKLPTPSSVGQTAVSSPPSQTPKKSDDGWDDDPDFN